MSRDADPFFRMATHFGHAAHIPGGTGGIREASLGIVDRTFPLIQNPPAQIALRPFFVPLLQSLALSLSFSLSLSLSHFLPLSLSSFIPPSANSATMA